MRKIIALGIMLLFLGMTISSSTGLYLNEQSIKPLSSGNILYVGGNGSGNYSKIQDAINDSVDGDTVFVYNGTYYIYCWDPYEQGGDYNLVLGKGESFGPIDIIRSIINTYIIRRDGELHIPEDITNHIVR